jgi:hypothetical protein
MVSLPFFSNISTILLHIVPPINISNLEAHTLLRILSYRDSIKCHIPVYERDDEENITQLLGSCLSGPAFQSSPWSSWQVLVF